MPAQTPSEAQDNDLDSKATTAPRPDLQSNANPARNAFFFLVNKKEENTPEPPGDSVPSPKRKHTVKPNFLANVETKADKAKAKPKVKTNQPARFTHGQRADLEAHKPEQPRTRLPTPIPKPRPNTRRTLGLGKVPRPIRRHILRRQQTSGAPRPYWWPGPRPRRTSTSVLWNQNCLKPEHELPALSRKLLRLLRQRRQWSVRPQSGSDPSVDVSYADELDAYLETDEQ